MIKLSDPKLPEAAISKAVEVLRSGNLVQGKEVESLEEAARSYIGSTHAIAVSSGTAALHMALVSLGITQGDEVIVPAFSFAATANVVELVGATPIFVDITLDDFCIDTNSLDRAVTERTKAIMPVHEFGQAAEWDEIKNVASRHRLPVIEDAACALGTTYNGQKCGSLGTIGCFSLHPRKAISTGEGGIITTDNDEIARVCKLLRNHGIERNAQGIEFVLPGFNYRLTEFQAAIGNVQFPLLESYIEKRCQLAAIYDELLGNMAQVKVPARFEKRRMVYQSYHIVLNRSFDRNSVVLKLRERGIEANLGAQAMPALAYYREKYGLPPNSFPNAYTAYTQGLVLPLGHHLEPSDIKIVAKALSEIVA